MTADDARTFRADAARHGDLSALLDRLEAAAAAATPGPWRRNSQPGVIFGNGADRPMPIAAGYSRPDAALIVAAVNAAPTLIAELRAHQAAVQAVRELADDFDANGNGCPLGDPSGNAWHKAARRIRAAVAALDPKEQTDE